MQLGFEVRYLSIDWLSKGVARKIDAAPMPLAIERSTDHESIVEATIFNDSYPWLGIRVLDDSVPMLVDANQQERPFLRVVCPGGEDVWCIFSDGWDSSRRQHVSELRRSAGVYRIRIGDQQLTLHNYISSFGRADIQAYVDDFRGNLLWMILNNQSGATVEGGGSGSGKELVPLLETLDSAARRVLAAPAMEVREDRERVPINKVRVTTETLREVAQNPLARRLTGRLFRESADTPENRYLRHMLTLVVAWTRSWLSAASRQQKFLNVVAEQEAQTAEATRTTTTRAVDPEIFDNQTKDIAKRVEALNQYCGSSVGDASRQHKFPIKIGARYGRETEYAFFYERVESARHDDQAVGFRVVVLPKEVFELVQAVRHVCDRFEIVGSPTSSLKETSRGRKYREIDFSTVHGVKPLVDVLGIRTEKRRSLEEAGWTVSLSTYERKEADREAKISDRRARLARTKLSELSGASNALLLAADKLEASEKGFSALGVSRSDVFPMGMTFFTNPAYVACMSAFKAAAELFGLMGFDPSLLEKVESFGVLHASDVYEKWCLLKLCSVLVEDFRFVPERDWIDRLVTATLRGETNIQLGFERKDIGLSVRIGYQQETRLGRRPDFVIQIADINDADQPLIGGAVLDSKFRSSWGWRSPAEVLQELIVTKGYGEILAGGKVFVLQPCTGTVADPLSPLEWGSDCDYGSGESHKKGWIQVGLGTSGVTSAAHLKRLLILVFQKAIDAPKECDSEWLSRGFCVGCGEPHSNLSIQWKETAGGGDKWRFNCGGCGVWTDRTRCYDCKTPLFKNGTRWTYHLTFAEQVSHIICPSCGSFFDEAYRASH